MEGRKIIGGNCVPRVFWIILMPLLALNILFAGLVIEFEYHHLHGENGFLENLQGLFLLISALAYFRLSRLSTADASLAYLGASLLCFSFFTREVDLELLPVIEHVGFLFHGTGRTIILLVVWSFYARLVVSQGALMSHVKRLRVGKYVHNFTICFVFLIVGSVFDRALLLVVYSRLFEELAETNAYLILALPAFYELYYRRRKSWHLPESVNANAK